MKLYISGQSVKIDGLSRKNLKFFGDGYCCLFAAYYSEELAKKAFPNSHILEVDIN